MKHMKYSPVPIVFPQIHTTACVFFTLLMGATSIRGQNISIFLAAPLLLLIIFSIDNDLFEYHVIASPVEPC